VGTHSYGFLDLVTLTATPSAGWVFDHWSGSIVGTTNPRSITMTGDKSVTAHFVSTGSGSTTPTPTPSPTPTPTPSPTPTPASCTSGMDEFGSSTLGTCWSWIREDRSKWSLSRGNLCITTQAGSLYFDSNDTRNVLLRAAPSGDFSIETHVYYAPTENFQKAGLVVYADDDNAAVLALAYCESSTPGCQGRGVFFDFESGGGLVGNPARHLGSSVNHVYLRITKTGTTLTGHYSLNGADWQYLGTHDLGTMAGRFNRVGLITDSGFETRAIETCFDFFAVQE